MYIMLTKLHHDRWIDSHEERIVTAQSHGKVVRSYPSMFRVVGVEGDSLFR